MNWSDIDRTPTSRKLRQFAAIGFVALGGMAAWQYLGRGHATAAGVLAAVALALGLAGLIRPQALRSVYVGAMLAAFPIGWAVSRLILATIFYGILTPIGLLFRVLGRDPLKIRRPADAASYWQPKSQPTDPRRYFRQF